MTSVAFRTAAQAAEDLQTIRAIRITDYKMKDRVRYGNKPFKKVIAQQVEQVYPQIVSKHADFIPNVYQLRDRNSKTANGYLLHFTGPLHLSDTASQLQAIVPNNSGMAAFRPSIFRPPRNSTERLRGWKRPSMPPTPTFAHLPGWSGNETRRRLSTGLPPQRLPNNLHT